MKQKQGRIMKRVIVVSLVIVLAIALTACGGFKIEGQWKQVGSETWGQAQSGSIVSFNRNGQANLFSPLDTYAFYKEGNDYRLDLSGLLGGDISFKVKIINNNNIELYSGSELQVALKRV